MYSMKLFTNNYLIAFHKTMLVSRFSINLISVDKRRRKQSVLFFILNEEGSSYMKTYSIYKMVFF